METRIERTGSGTAETMPEVLWTYLMGFSNGVPCETEKATTAEAAPARVEAKATVSDKIDKPANWRRMMLGVTATGAYLAALGYFFYTIHGILTGLVLEFVPEVL